MKKTCSRVLICALCLSSNLGFGLSILNRLPDSPACRNFIEFAVGRKVDPRYPSADYGPLKPFQTDGIQVLKNGLPLFEWHDGLMSAGSPHILWSASKMITATLLARMIQERYAYHGQLISLSTELRVFFPRPGGAPYDAVTLGQLVEMTANFVWKEYYDEDIQNSSFIPMLYSMDGRQNMAEFALRQPISPEGPGGRWNYSGGNMNILMAALEKIYVANNPGRGAERMAQHLLFGPLGIANSVIERDGSGHAVGSSYVYLPLSGMSAIGQLYLQDGKWRGVRLLPKGWVQDARTLNDAVSLQATTLEVIKKLGTPSRRIFWLNTPIYRADGASLDGQTGRRILYPAEMPEAPADLYFAAGHYGQIIVVVPSAKLVIARTGYDEKYWDHVQPLVVKALSCLNPTYRPNENVDLLPPSHVDKPGVLSPILDGLSLIFSSAPSVNYVKDQGISVANTAKEMCSFLYVEGAATRLREDHYVTEYKNRSGLPPVARFALMSDLEYSFNPGARSVTVTQHGFRGDSSDFLFKSRYTSRVSAADDAGCTLVRDP